MFNGACVTQLTQLTQKRNSKINSRVSWGSPVDDNNGTVCTGTYRTAEQWIKRAVVEVRYMSYHLICIYYRRNACGTPARKTANRLTISLGCRSHLHFCTCSSMAELLHFLLYSKTLVILYTIMR